MDVVDEWRRYAGTQVAARIADALERREAAALKGRRAVLGRAVLHWRSNSKQARDDRARGEFRAQLRKTAAHALRSFSHQHNTACLPDV